MVASWCSSCQTGSTVVGDHIADLGSRGIRVVEMRLANDLGAPGPGLQRFQKAVGMNAASPNWYWGELTRAQTAVLDPKGYPDLYYLVDAKGSIVLVDGRIMGPHCGVRIERQGSDPPTPGLTAMASPRFRRLAPQRSDCSVNLQQHPPQYAASTGTHSARSLKGLSERT